jgi:nucleoid-associated protein YgaU
MAKVRVAKNSLLRFHEFVELDGVSFWQHTELPEFEESTTDVEYRVAHGDRIDALAKRFYGDPRLWWVICWANAMALPAVEMYTGRVIRVPQSRRILDELLRGG